MADKKKALYRSLWKRAWLSESGRVELELGDKAVAKRVRTGLYNSVKAARNGSEGDWELVSAANSCAVYVEGETMLVIARTDKGGDMRKVMAAAGVTEEEVAAMEGVKTRFELEEEEANRKAIEKFNSFAAQGVMIPRPQGTANTGAENILGKDDFTVDTERASRYR